MNGATWLWYYREWWGLWCSRAQSSWLWPLRMQTPWSPFFKRHWKARFSSQISWLVDVGNQFTVFKHTVRAKNGKNIQKPHLQTGHYLLCSLWRAIWLSEISLPIRHYLRSFTRDPEVFICGDFLHSYYQCFYLETKHRCGYAWDWCFVSSYKWSERESSPPSLLPKKHCFMVARA